MLGGRPAGCVEAQALSIPAGQPRKARGRDLVLVGAGIELLEERSKGCVAGVCLGLGHIGLGPEDLPRDGVEPCGHDVDECKDVKRQENT